MSRSDTRFYASELARRERYDAELQGLTARIDEISRNLRGVYTTGMKQSLRAERDRLIANRAALKQKRKAYVMRSTNPFEQVWNLCRSHPVWTLLLILFSVMVPAGPQAMAGYAMIVGTLWFLVTAFRGIKRHYERRLDAKTVQHNELFTSESAIDVPGGILTIKGDISLEQMQKIKVEFEAAHRSGARNITILSEGAQFIPVGPGIPDRVSAMHADDAPYEVDTSTDGVHPSLPPWMRTAWDGALAEYRHRVGVEGVKYRDLKTEFAGLYRAILGRDDMIDWSHRQVTPSHCHVSPDLSTLQRIERGLEAISDEGARYGELLWRAANGEDVRRYVTEDDELVLKGQQAVPSPEMPRSFIPVLDRAFELTTDCRYHHVAEHALVETDLHPGYVVRTCTVCSPATFWIERA